MAAAYAALLSLTHVLENVQLYANAHISLNQNEKDLIESLCEKVFFLLDVVESHANGGCKAEGLESRVRNAAHEAEDIIESHIADQIRDGSRSPLREKSSVFFRGCIRNGQSSTHFSRGLQKVIEDMDSVKKEMMKIGEGERIEDKPARKSTSASFGPSKAPPVFDKKGAVGLEDMLIQVLDRLTGQESNRQIIPIVGMGGIGKTTLARTVYEHPLIVHYFDIRAWVTVSQEYSVRDILLGLLDEIGVRYDERDEDVTENELGGILYKKLFGMRYLIVMDDVWGIEAWDRVRLFLPDNKQGSRVMITTRLSNVANHFCSRVFEMSFLDEDKSWSLLCKKIFPNEDCPPKLMATGKRIAKNCKGLPLLIIVIGGVLAKSDHTIQFWKYVAEGVSSTINLENDGHCLNVLSLSYSHLPIHLKPCFLYLGVFPEDHEIRVSKLVKLWTAEGLVKPNKTKIFEEVAEEYLKELVDRNLVLVRKWGSSGKIKTCIIHDLLRELCLKEAERQNFYINGVHPISNSLPAHILRHIVIQESALTEKDWEGQVNSALQLAPFARTLTCDLIEDFSCQFPRLLRVFNVISPPYGAKFYFYYLHQLANLRYLAINASSKQSFPSLHLWWNLQTIIAAGLDENTIAPSKFWEMRQLRHVKTNIYFQLPNPPARQMKGQADQLVLDNLQSVGKIMNFTFCDEVVKRIPNIKKLQIGYFGQMEGNEGWSYYCLDNLRYLSKIESLTFFFFVLPVPWDLSKNLVFPHSLKKLSLQGSNIKWEDMTIIGSLPLLEVLRLSSRAFIGPEWNPVEGEFLRLKFFQMDSLYLERWVADNTHFPCLESLVLLNMNRLVEIPLGFVDIPTLRSIRLSHCSDAVVISAKNLVEEGESLGVEDLYVQVKCSLEKMRELEHLASSNFALSAD